MDVKKILKSKKTIIIAGIILGLGIILVVLKLTVFAGAADSTLEALPPANAEKMTVKSIVNDNSIDVSGNIEPIETRVYAFPKAGTVEKIYVKEKSTVKKNQILAKLVSVNEEYEIKNLDLQIETMKISGNTRTLNLTVLKRQVAVQNLEECYLQAGFDGIVSEITLQEGVSIGARSGSDYIKLIDTSTYIASVELDELDVVQVKEQQSVEIEFDALPDQKIKGIVFSVPLEGRVGSEGIAVMDVELHFKDIPEKIKTGFSFSGTIKAGSEEPVVVVPRKAVIQRNGKNMVLVEKEGAAPDRREIMVTEFNTEYFKVVSGLTEGEVVLAVAAENSNQKQERPAGLPFGDPVQRQNNNPEQRPNLNQRQR